MVDPVETAFREDRSVVAQSGCSVTAWMVAGTSTVKVGRSRSIAASVASGVKRGWMVTVAPWCSAGVVWMLRPPTWKNGSTVST